MKLIKIIIFTAALSLTGPVFPQLYYTEQAPDVHPFMDSAFQDYVETAHGYMNPENAPKTYGDFRDSLTALPTVTYAEPTSTSLPAPQVVPRPKAVVARTVIPKLLPSQHFKVTLANEGGALASFVNPLGSEYLSGFRASNYVFISIMPKTADYAEMVGDLSVSGFKFAGEKIFYFGTEKRIHVLGWVPYSNLAEVCSNPSVAKVSLEKRMAGVPFKTKVRFTLKAPSGSDPGVFVAEFLKRLESGSGFTAEKTFRLPGNGGHAKFVAYDITGSLPVDMVGELSKSPFVAAVEFKDKTI